MVTKPLKWHGGKHYLAKRIVALMPEHVHYVEPYFGGGSVLLTRDLDGVSAVVNDVDGELMNFWRVLQNPKSFSVFHKVMTVTPFSEQEWRDAVEGKSVDKVTRAALFFIRMRQSRQGLGKDFATLTRRRTRRGMNEQASAWLSCIEGLPEVHRLLQRVVVLNRDALAVILQQDDNNTHFYCDPPYLARVRSGGGEFGKFEMSDKDHKKLLVVLSKIKGTFQLSGYRSSIYDRAASRYGWRRKEIRIDNKASGSKKKEKRVECLWMNY